ncbi:unnamed protein product [Strongylus vulgaris]|nr:unnamed protein product [Strongylus vulgaris]
MLTPSVVDPLREWCRNCIITLEYACGIGKSNFTIKELITACADHEYIRPPPGVVLVITSDMVTQEQLDRLLAKVVYLEMCIEIKHSSIMSLRIPNLKEIRPCQPGRPAILIENNVHFEELIIPPTAIYPAGELIIRIVRTPSLPHTTINEIQQWCPYCTVTHDYSS